MYRPKINQLAELLECPECGTSLEVKGHHLFCSSCDDEIPNFKSRPILIKSDNPLFPKSAYLSTKENSKACSIKRTSTLKKIKNWAPSRSINLSRARIFGDLAEKSSDQACKILVVGGGNQASDFEATFVSSKTEVIFTDIDKLADVDVFCDAHQLPFKDSSFDIVITTAVMEHVLSPTMVAQEIHRVLNNHGLIYSEVPFLQGVHEGAYDFTRFSAGGHRKLFDCFDELEVGMVAGPGTSLVWALTDFSKSLFRNKKLSKIAFLSARICFGWIKYLDKHLANNPASIDYASCTYFYGTKRDNPRPPLDIIERYTNSDFGHV